MSPTIQTIRSCGLDVTVTSDQSYFSVYTKLGAIAGTLSRRRIGSLSPYWTVANRDGVVVWESDFCTTCLKALARDLEKSYA
jgi:hypothetical protein